MKNLLAIAFVFACLTQLQAAKWYVAPNGNNNNNGSLAAPFKTLPTAIEAAEPGDEIFLRGGQYVSQEIRINKNNLHIQSYPGEWAVIKAVTNVEDISSCIWYDEPETTGGTLERLEIVGGYYYALKFETNWDWDNSVPFSQRRGVSNVTVKDCILHHSGRDGIKLTPACANISILNCEIHHTGVGPGAQIDLNAEGIDNVNAPNLTVRGCYIHDIATTGIYVKGGGENCVIDGNHIENCGEGGIYLGFYTDADWFDTDKNPEYFENINGLVLNNLIVNTQHAGIGLWGAKDARVFNNTVVQAGQAEHAALFFNTTDVWLDDNNSARMGSQNVRVQNNLFVQTAGQTLAMVRVRENSLIGATNTVNHNIYYDPNGAVFMDDNLDWQEWDLAQWQAQTALDLNSAVTNPLLNAEHHLSAGSPCINAGTPISVVTTDLDAHARTDGLLDIGADEFGTVLAAGTPKAWNGLDVKVLGNPTSAEKIVFEVRAEQSFPGQIQVLDAQGRVMVQKNVFVPAGESVFEMPVLGLVAGQYLLRMGGASVWVILL